MTTYRHKGKRFNPYITPLPRITATIIIVIAAAAAERNTDANPKRHNRQTRDQSGEHAKGDDDAPLWRVGVEMSALLAGEATSGRSHLSWTGFELRCVALCYAAAALGCLSFSSLLSSLLFLLFRRYCFILVVTSRLSLQRRLSFLSLSFSLLSFATMSFSLFFGCF